MYKNHQAKLSAKTQEDGAQVVGYKGQEYLPFHQIQIEVSAQPTAGTLAIEYRTPGASEYVTVTGSPVDLTELNKATALRVNNCFVEAWRFTPSDLDEAKTYNVIIQSNE